MELINKKHESITQNLRINLSPYFKIQDYKSVYFSAGVGKLFGLCEGLFVHFQNDEDRWYFYCNNENDGFKLLGKENKKCTIIYDASLVKLIQKRTLISIGTKFLVEITNCKVKNAHLFEIMLNKPIEDKEEPIIKNMEFKNKPVFYPKMALSYPTPKKAI